MSNIIGLSPDETILKFDEFNKNVLQLYIIAPDLEFRPGVGFTGYSIYD
jgi:hypothetical protein